MGMGLRVGVSVFWSPLLCVWKRRGMGLCGVPSPSVMASFLNDKDKGLIYSPLDSHLGVGDPRPSR